MTWVAGPCATTGCPNKREPRDSYCIECALMGRAPMLPTGYDGRRGRPSRDFIAPPPPPRLLRAPLRVRLVCMACSRESRQPGRCLHCGSRVFAEPALLGRTG